MNKHECYKNPTKSMHIKFKMIHKNWDTKMICCKLTQLLALAS